MAAKSETREVRNFTEVEIQGYGDLILEQDRDARTESLVVEADETILPRIKSEVRGNRLVLGFQVDWWDWGYWIDWLFNPNKKVLYHLTMKQINGAGISGSGKVTAKHIETEDCQFRISGSGKVLIDELKANALRTTISGSGDVSLAGAAKQHELSISGSGSLHARELETQCSQVRISGSGSAVVNVRETLDVHISGSGSIKYAGKPKVTQHISGAGRVAQVG